MKNLGDVVGEMKIAYVNGCVSFGMQFQNWVNFLLLECQDSERTSMMDVKRIFGSVSRVVIVLLIFKCFGTQTVLRDLMEPGHRRVPGLCGNVGG